MSTLSKILVVIQFTCLVSLVYYARLSNNILLLVLQILGFSISIWAVLIMRIGNFNIQPEVKNSARLVSTGPYKLIRNPMYSGLLLFFAAGLFDSFQLLELIAYAILFVALLIKINLEEKYLTLTFGNNYTAYKENTYRLLPYVY